MAVVHKIIALALVGVVAGCSASPSSPSAHAGFGDASGSPGSSESPSSAAPSAAALVSTVSGETYFKTPSGNITCVLESTQARCDILNRSWQPPPKPAACGLGWGNGMIITKGQATFVCAGDTVLGAAKSTLEYGQGLRAGDLECDSQPSGISCIDNVTGHGFTLAIADYNQF